MITTKFTSWQGAQCFYVLWTGLSIFSVILGFAGWRSRWFRQCLLFVYNYLLSTHLTWYCGLLRTVLLKLSIFRPYNFSFVVCPSVLDDLPPLVVVASSSSCPNLLRVFNYIVRVSKIAVYLLRGEVHVDFSSSNVDDCFNGAEKQSPKDDGWIVLVFSHVKNLQPFRMSDLPSGVQSTILSLLNCSDHLSWLGPHLLVLVPPVGPLPWFHVRNALRFV